MNLREMKRLLGPGTPAQWTDDRGQHVSVLLYRSGRTVLATVVEIGHVTGLEFFERMTDSEAHDEFSLARASEPYATHVALAQMTWLARPVFSETLPTPPPKWNVPTDFTSAQTNKSFYVTHGDHAVSKVRSKAYGWMARFR